MTRSRDASSEVVAEVLAEEGLNGRRVLLAGGADLLREEVADLGATVTTWHRSATNGRAATAWPADGPFDDVVLRLPVGKDALRLLIAALGRRLAPGGRIWLHGANDEGIKSCDKALLERFDQVTAPSSKKHCRIFRAEGLQAMPEEPAPERFTATVAGVDLDWLSWPGLFAHGRIDPATHALLEKLPVFEGKVLDFGCGAGVISQFMQRRDGITADLSDVDALAVETARLNVPDAQVILADGLPEATGRYRAIVSNPPLHLGKDLEPGLLRTLVAAAPKRLGRSGELWITTQGAFPLQALLREHFPQVHLVTRDKRFTVWRAVR